MSAELPVLLIKELHQRCEDSGLMVVLWPHEHRELTKLGVDLWSSEFEPREVRKDRYIYGLNPMRAIVNKASLLVALAVAQELES